jgi:beta-glucosidase
VLNFDHATPASDAPEDRAAAVQDAIFNRWFIEGITRQSYPAEAMEGLAPHLPAGWQDDMALIGSRWTGWASTTTPAISMPPPPAPPGPPPARCGPPAENPDGMGDLPRGAARLS